jgi:phenylacetate-CoA ligase
MSALRGLYDRAPVVIQNVMLSTYGLWLRRLRYGAGHRARVAALRALEGQTRFEWQRTQAEALSRVIDLARRDVPYYRRTLPPGLVNDAASLAKLPILTKEAVQTAGRMMISEKFARKRLQEIHTGGTTGRPLIVYCDDSALKRNYAFFFRVREWAGIGHNERVATFAGRTIVQTARGAPYWRHNWASKTLLLSSYHLAPDALDAYLDALVDFRPQMIDSYPSSLEPIARRALQRGEKRIRPKGIITSSETLFPEVRQIVEEAFGCPVFDQYGSAEMAACISQCEHGKYHAHPEYGVVEILVDGRPAKPGETGEIVATGFINEAMPFIRYATGDLAVPGEGPCQCGRTFPIVERIEGRQDDCVITPEGRRVGRLDPIFKSVEGIHEARIVQDAADHLRIELVPRPVVTPAEEATLRDELQRRVGTAMRLTFVRVEQIPRTARGKLRTVVNEFAKHTKASHS